MVTVPFTSWFNRLRSTRPLGYAWPDRPLAKGATRGNVIGQASRFHCRTGRLTTTPRAHTHRDQYRSVDAGTPQVRVESLDRNKQRSLFVMTRGH